MARIESYSPGRVVVDGVELHRDVIVLPVVHGDAFVDNPSVSRHSRQGFTQKL